MTHLPPPSTPRGNPITAVSTGLLVFAVFTCGFLYWLWPLGDFGAWNLHWPYIKDAIKGYFGFRGAGNDWWRYYHAMSEDGYLVDLYVRLAALVGIGSLISVSVATKIYAYSKPRTVHVRGLQYIRDTDKALRLAKAQAARERRQEGRAGVKIHPEIRINAGRENLGFLAVGAQGSGKTQFLLPILQQVIEQGHRALIFDYKGEYTEVLPVEDENMILIAPWDQRSAQWRIAADVTTRTDARLIAQLLIRDSDDPMWSNAARQVLTGLINYLCRSQPGAWTFADLANLISASSARLVHVLRRGNPEVVRLVENLLEDGKTAQSVMVNMSAYMAAITDLAEAWDDNDEALPEAWPNRGFSIQRWLADDYEGPRILLLQGSARYEPLMQGLMASFLAVLIARVIDPGFPEARRRNGDYRLFFFLDEFPRLGRITDIEKLIAVGRSKGARLLLGFQDIAQVRALYGPDVAAAWFSQLATQFYGRVAPGDTANWVASVLGKREVEQPTHSLAANQQQPDQAPGMTETIGWQSLDKQLILPGQLATELAASPRGVTGLLQCTGWPHLYRLNWPITQLEQRRPSSIPAAWTQPRPFSPADEPLPESSDAGSPSAVNAEQRPKFARRTTMPSVAEPTADKQIPTERPTREPEH